MALMVAVAAVTLALVAALLLLDHHRQDD